MLTRRYLFLMYHRHRHTLTLIFIVYYHKQTCFESVFCFKQVCTKEFFHLLHVIKNSCICFISLERQFCTFRKKMMIVIILLVWFVSLSKANESLMCMECKCDQNIIGCVVIPSEGALEGYIYIYIFKESLGYFTSYSAKLSTSLLVCKPIYRHWI